VDHRSEARQIIASTFLGRFGGTTSLESFWKQPLKTSISRREGLFEFLELLFKMAEGFRLGRGRLDELMDRPPLFFAIVTDKKLDVGEITGEELIGLVDAYLTEGMSQNRFAYNWYSQGGTGSMGPPPDAPPTLEPPVAMYSGGGGGGNGGDDENASVVRVFYATDRMQVVGKGDPRYDHGRSTSGQISYGECAISIPRVHKLGKLETPSILRLEFSPDPEKHIVLQEVRNLEESIFLERVAASVAKSAAKEAFIFIHGYKVSFEDAARRTGQIAFDLHFVGAPIFYSWPSNGKLADYLKDETNITWSTPHFQRFLSLLSQHSGAKRIHIIAHSMGNRAVCDALKALSYDPNINLRFNHLLLAAPDIDADTFRELAATLQRLSDRITLYESSKDKAIQASKKIHGNPRAGEPLLIIPGLDTIDASAIDTDFLGHSYFSDNWPLLSDIHSILFKDDPPGARFGLMEMQHPDGKYYAFRS
jgi:esterase/lipase superfamily enzyme